MKTLFLIIAGHKTVAILQEITAIQIQMQNSITIHPAIIASTIYEVEENTSPSRQ